MVQKLMANPVECTIDNQLYRFRMPLKEEVSIFLIFGSTHMFKKKRLIPYDGHSRQPANQCSQLSQFSLKQAIFATLVCWLSLRAILGFPIFLSLPLNTVSTLFEPRGPIFQNGFLTSDCHKKNAQKLQFSLISWGWGSIQEWGSNNVDTVSEHSKM